MNLKQLVEALDAQVVKGDIISAFEQFAADHCVTLSSPEDKTTNKAQKVEALRWFFTNVAKVNHIERPAFAVVNDNVTDSQFTFHFTDNWGNPMVYNEVIRRTWDNGKIVEEVYLMGQSLNGAAEKATTKKTAAKPVAEPKTVETKPTAKKSAGPVADKKPATKSAKATTETVAKTDDLTIIEGVGPKIAELLIAAGIKSFKELAAAKPAALKAILEAAGKRYQMHDPGSWPKQAALARDGKTAELAQLQAALKGGK
jgi:large subunit ribosomal protein L27